MCHKNYLKGLLFVSTISYASPDAGNISKDIESQLEQTRNKTSALPSIKEEQIQKTIQKTQNNSYMKVLVNGFKISGNNSLKTEEIDSVISVFKTQKLSFDELQDIPRVIADFYSQNGLSARAYFPPQEIENGILEVVIIEGILSDIEIEGIDAKRMSSERARRIIENSHPVGQTLETKKLEKGVYLLADNPGVQVNSSLVSGEEAGESKLKVKLNDAPLLNGALLYSNTGQKSTGQNQYILSGAVNSPSSIGDQIVFQGMKTSGIDYGRFGYNLPIGYSGLRAGFNATKMKYDVVSGSDADGKSQTLEFALSYPIIKNSETDLKLSVGYDAKEYINNSYSVLVSDKTNDVYNLTISGYTNDTHGQTSYSTSFNRGKLDLSNSNTDYSTDQQTAQTNGDFSKVVFNLSRKQVLTEDINLLVSGTLQKANKNLDSSEKLYLGGISGIKAYPTNEGGGDEGYIINTKIVKQLPYGFSTNAFYDYGEIKQHKNLYTNWQGSSSADNTYSLQGIGVGLGYVKNTFSVDTTLAFRIDDNPNALANGNDSDGTKKEPRIWIQLTKLF